MKRINILVLAAILVVAVSGMAMAKTGKFDVNLNVLKWAEVGTPGSLSIDLFDGNATNNSASGTFDIKTNFGINLDVSSTGFSNTILNDYITYEAGGTTGIVPGTSGGASNVLSVSAAQSKTATFTVRLDEASLMSNEAWETIPASTVITDTVTLTVSAQ